MQSKNAEYKKRVEQITYIFPGGTLFSDGSLLISGGDWTVERDKSNFKVIYQSKPCWTFDLREPDLSKENICIRRLPILGIIIIY